jgi:hypothetical protein
VSEPRRLGQRRDWAEECHQQPSAQISARPPLSAGGSMQMRVPTSSTHRHGASASFWCPSISGSGGRWGPRDLGSDVLVRWRGGGGVGHLVGPIGLCHAVPRRLRRNTGDLAGPRGQVRESGAVPPL